MMEWAKNKFYGLCTAISDLVPHVVSIMSRELICYRFYLLPNPNCLLLKDFEGQRLAENLFHYILLLFGVSGLL